MNKWFPDRKWLASGIAGLLAFFLTQLLSLAGVDIPEAVATSIVGGVMWLVHYLVTPSVKDLLKRVDDTLKALDTPEGQEAQIDGKVPAVTIPAPG